MLVTKRRLAALQNVALAALLCSSCASSPKMHSGIYRYADLQPLVGQKVVLAGYWSAQHEATGVYFGNRDFRDAPKQCVMTEPLLSAAHGSSVRVSGVLERSGCGDELICLTVCQPYILRNASVVR
jgi:hypothetical protein